LVTQRERRGLLVAGGVGVALAAAGTCGIVMWIFPTAPPWAVKSVVLGATVAVFALGALRIWTILWYGGLGVAKRSRGSGRPVDLVAAARRKLAPWIQRLRKTWATWRTTKR
jgi:hypothetical protein